MHTSLDIKQFRCLQIQIFSNYYILSPDIKIDWLYSPNHRYQGIIKRLRQKTKQYNTIIPEFQKGYYPLCFIVLPWSLNKYTLDYTRLWSQHHLWSFKNLENMNRITISIQDICHINWFVMKNNVQYFNLLIYLFLFHIIYYKF